MPQPQNFCEKNCQQKIIIQLKTMAPKLSPLSVSKPKQEFVLGGDPPLEANSCEKSWQ